MALRSGYSQTGAFGNTHSCAAAVWQSRWVLSKVTIKIYEQWNLWRIGPLESPPQKTTETRKYYNKLCQTSWKRKKILNLCIYWHLQASFYLSTVMYFRLAVLSGGSLSRCGSLSLFFFLFFHQESFKKNACAPQSRQVTDLESVKKEEGS